MKILIIEDELLIAMEQQLHLESCGHEVFGPAVDADEGVELAASVRPDLALVDVHLARDTSGIDAACGLAAFGVPCLFVTSYPEDVLANRQLGLGYLVKPFSRADLIGAVRVAEAILNRQPLPSVPSVMTVFDGPSLPTG